MKYAHCVLQSWLIEALQEGVKVRVVIDKNIDFIVDQYRIDPYRYRNRYRRYRK
jgi:hypothetical protein